MPEHTRPELTAASLGAIGGTLTIADRIARTIKNLFRPTDAEVIADAIRYGLDRYLEVAGTLATAKLIEAEAQIFIAYARIQEANARIQEANVRLQEAQASRDAAKVLRDALDLQRAQVQAAQERVDTLAEITLLLHDLLNGYVKIGR